MTTDYSSPAYLQKVDKYWRAANYLSVGQLYLKDNPLLQRPLKASDVKVHPIGHWGRLPVKTLSMLILTGSSTSTV